MAKRAQGTHSMLRIRDASGARIEDLVRDVYSIGRGDPSGEMRVDFVLAEDPHVSRVHFVLRRAKGTFVLENKSPNGTFVNGKAAEQPLPLKPGDKIVVGSVSTLEFLLLDDAQRSRELGIAAGGKASEDRKGKDGEGSKGLLQRPAVLAVLAIYLVGMVVLAINLMEDEEPQSTYPGSGPYLTSLLDDPIETVTPSEDAVAMADASWQKAREEYEPELTVGPHAYYLVQAARQLMRVRGHTSLRAAVSAGDSDAQVAKAALDGLETRLAALMKEAVQYLRGGHWEKARAVFEEILIANPARESALREYALSWTNKLSPSRR